MKIALIDYAAEGAGAKSILEDFYRHVVQNGLKHEWLFFLSLVDLPPLPNIRVIRWPEVKRSRLARIWFDMVQAPRRIAAYEPDLVISLQNLALMGYGGHQFVYVHQAIPFQKIKRFSFFKKDEHPLAFYQYIYPILLFPGLRRAEKIFVQTEWMKRKIAERVKVPAERIIVETPVINIDGDYPSRQDKVAVSNTFVYPAEPLCYKNHTCIVDAVRELIHRGHSDFRVLFTLQPHMRQSLGAEGIEQIEFLSRIPKTELFALYQQSVLLFPSYIESFGLPLLEARKLGRVVFASDTEVSREVLEGYDNAHFFDPFLPAQLADLMEMKLNGHIPCHDVEGLVQLEQESGWQEMFRYIEMQARG